MSMSATAPDQDKGALTAQPTPAFRAKQLAYAVRLIRKVGARAGSAHLLDEIRLDDAGGVHAAVQRRDTPALFDWLASAFSYQGISNQVAYEYMEQHGYVAWRDVEARLGRQPGCPKLRSYWHFYDCRYDQLSRTCSQPCRVRRCPLPRHDLRNGRLNQTAYSLFLFIRDIADGDLVGWIDNQLLRADQAGAADRLASMRAAVIEPMREIYGVSDKVLAMALSSILLAAPTTWRRWIEVGGSMVAIDTLVHNFLHRTGILHRLAAGHAYGTGCYHPGSCADIITAVAQHIDARAFNASFPRTFPRFVQHAIWRFCAQDGQDICNGNRIDDSARCENLDCQLYKAWDRVLLA